MKIGALLCFAVLSSCTPRAPIAAPVVADAGAATKAVPAAIENGREAEQERLSKVAAGAESIRTINAGQPPSPRTDGVRAEAELILSVAGTPAAADRATAAERARLVAEGKAEEVTRAYAAASGEAAVARRRAEEAEKALTGALAKAAAEQEVLRSRLQAEMDRIAREANERVDAATAKTAQEARAWQRKVITLGTFGVGILLIVAGVVVKQAAASVPMFGPKAGNTLLIAGASLVALGILITQVQNFLDEHPWVTGLFIIVSALAVVAGVALMYANHKHRPQSV